MEFRRWLLFFGAACLFALSGCSKDEKQVSLQEIEPGSVYTGEINLPLPEASGPEVYEGSGVTVDASHAEDGYIMVKCTGATARLKVRIVLGDEEYTYDLNQKGEYEVFPLQMGNGDYEVTVFQNIEGTKYSPLYQTALSVTMPDEDRVFLFPSQYVWYTNEESAVKLSYDLCEGLETDKQKVGRIYDYLVWLLEYDYEKAATVESGYIPDLSEILQIKKGICFDYAALMAAMLRAQDIPVRLVIGYVQPDNLYHAWNQVYMDGAWVWMDATFGPDSTRKEADYTQDRRY